jgi:REP element-mobilizing transposase RayT
MAQVLQTLDCPALIINGTEDHVHVLFSLSRQHAIKTIVEKMKADPSKWIKSKGPAYRHFYWQAGYGAFSVSESQAPKVRTYIANQAEHHHRQTFQEEFRAICQKHGIEWDERYVWD